MQIAPGSDNTALYALVVCDEVKDDESIPPGFPVLGAVSPQSARKLDHLFVLCSAVNLLAKALVAHKGG